MKEQEALINIFEKRDHYQGRTPGRNQGSEEENTTINQ